MLAHLPAHAELRTIGAGPGSRDADTVDFDLRQERDRVEKVLETGARICDALVERLHMQLHILSEAMLETQHALHRVLGAMKHVVTVLYLQLVRTLRLR